LKVLWSVYLSRLIDLNTYAAQHWRRSIPALLMCCTHSSWWLVKKWPSLGRGAGCSAVTDASQNCPIGVVGVSPRGSREAPVLRLPLFRRRVLANAVRGATLLPPLCTSPSPRSGLWLPGKSLSPLSRPFLPRGRSPALSSGTRAGHGAGGGCETPRSTLATLWHRERSSLGRLLPASGPAVSKIRRGKASPCWERGPCRAGTPTACGSGRGASVPPAAPQLWAQPRCQPGHVPRAWGVCRDAAARGGWSCNKPVWAREYLIR